MNVVRVYRTLLYLYPNDFRQQFSEEMVDVFQQKAHDLTAGGGVVFASSCFANSSVCQLGQQGHG